MGFASLEHLLIQLGVPAGAEEYAQAIPENTPDCVLAKAEALAAVASAWSRAGDTEHARAAFTAAIAKLDLVADLPYGRAWIAADIAARQAAAGFVATSRDTFALAAKFGGEIPRRPKPVNGVYPQNYAGRHYREDGYRAVFQAQLRARDIGGAFRTADLWRAAGGDADDVAIECLDAGYPAEALQYARSVQQPMERADALARIARSLLDNAGAPLF